MNYENISPMSDSYDKIYTKNNGKKEYSIDYIILMLRRATND